MSTSNLMNAAELAELPPVDRQASRIARVLALLSEFRQLFGQAEQPDQVLLQTLLDSPDQAIAAMLDFSDRYADRLAALITADDLAGRWRVTRKDIRQLAKQGALPGLKHPRYGWLFGEQAIAAFEQRQQQELLS